MLTYLSSEIPRSDLDQFFLCVLLDRRALGDEITIAVRVIDARDRRPEFAVTQSGDGIGGLASRVLVRPRVGRDVFSRMRSVLEDVVCLVRASVGDGLDFVTDGDHRVAESIQLFLRLAFGRLDHQRAGDWK